jgi:hypothetical protein
MTFLARVGRLFPRNETLDTVDTSRRFGAAPDAVWEAMLFYEEVPTRPTRLLRLFLPTPVRTQGDKTHVGATIACTYERGYLEKRITAVERPRLITFDVTVQSLGIEDSVRTTGGSYNIRGVDEGSEVVLTTLYRGHLRPRWLWKRFEQLLAHRLHHHILAGIRATLETAGRARTGSPRPSPSGPQARIEPSGPATFPQRRSRESAPPS